LEVAEDGLRFDAETVEAERISEEPPTGQQLPDKNINSLLVTRDDTLCAHFQID
jgi:hypothetical protein